MTEAQQLSLLGSDDTRQHVAAHIKDMLANALQPSARELVAELDRAFGIVARWDLEAVLASLVDDEDLTRAQHAYLRWLLEEEDLLAALRGESAPDGGKRPPPSTACCRPVAAIAIRPTFRR